MLQLVSKSYLEGWYYSPAAIDRELMEEYKDGLTAILPRFPAGMRALLLTATKNAP